MARRTLFKHWAILLVLTTVLVVGLVLWLFNSLFVHDLGLSAEETLRVQGLLTIAMALSATLLSLALITVTFPVIKEIRQALRAVQEKLHRVSHGESFASDKSFGLSELNQLNSSMELMGLELSNRLERLNRSSAEREAVFSSMREGVLALDLEGRIIRINEAAAKILDANMDRSTGRHMEEVVRATDLQRLIRLAQESEETIETEISIHTLQRVLHVYARSLLNDKGEKLGVLIVLNDVTRLRELENVRRDFVANVSHELKTPITSIKGFVETLLDGAIDDRADAHRFLSIISQQADRLNSIFDDLLNLARLEDEQSKSQLQFVEHSIGEVLNGAKANCEAKALAKNINLTVRCSNSIVTKINPGLVEQAVVNLLDNAIKYSESGSAVEVSAELKGPHVRIDVRDFGCGIERVHLKRLFERFYRVDKSRSRDVGGNGLGLAIVKHIAQLHGGSVSVESTIGKGSTFSLHLSNGATDAVRFDEVSGG